MIYRLAVAFAFYFSLTFSSFAQITLGDDITDFDYSNPKEYEIGGITISGIQYLDQDVLIMLSGLYVGERIMVPGEEITGALKKLWDQGFFEHISITATRIQGDLIFLNITLKERPRLSKFTFTGVKKSESENLRDEILDSIKIVGSKVLRQQ